MTIEPMVRAAYEKIEQGDVDALLEMFHDEARFFIDGRTQISGDHTKDGFRAVAPKMFATGSVRREVIAILADEEWAAVIAHEYVRRGEDEFNYHVMHNWSVRDGKFIDFWVYLHEYEQFASAWRADTPIPA